MGKKKVSLILSLFILTTILGCNSSSVDTKNLHWDVPIARESGEPLSLSEIGGYRIYASEYIDGDYSLHDDVQEPTYSFEGTSRYVYVTTYDVAGDESKISNIVFTGGDS